MNWNSISEPHCNLLFFYGTHESGLKVLLSPMHQYRNVQIRLGVHFGSVDCQIVDLQGNIRILPPGTAHFLEHQIFEDEKGKAFGQFADAGVQANAVTSFDRTIFNIQSGLQWKNALQILLKMLFNSHISEQTVQKERKIIRQEIQLMEDQPMWQMLQGLLHGLYGCHPICNPVAGTEESLAMIDADLLNYCHHIFYTPDRMVLSLAGPVEPKELAGFLDSFSFDLKSREFFTVPVQESEAVIQKKWQRKGLLPFPIYAIGFKEKITSGTELARLDVDLSLLLNLLFGESSVYFQKKREAEIWNDQFGYEWMSGRNYRMTLLSGQGGKPDDSCHAVLDRIEQIRTEGISSSDLIRVRKAQLGEMIRLSMRPESVADLLLESVMNGYLPSDQMERLISVTENDLKKDLDFMFLEKNMSFSVLEP